jgi:hypothetical protein
MTARLLLFVRGDSFTGTLNLQDAFTIRFDVLSQTSKVVIQSWGFGGGIKRGRPSDSRWQVRSIAGSFRWQWKPK